MQVEKKWLYVLQDFFYQVGYRGGIWNVFPGIRNINLSYKYGNEGSNPISYSKKCFLLRLIDESYFVMKDFRMQLPINHFLFELFYLIFFILRFSQLAHQFLPFTHLNND